MKRIAPFLSLTIFAQLLAANPPLRAQGLIEPGAAPGVELTNISNNPPEFASVFPQVAVSRSNPNLVAVAWRQYGLPIDTTAPMPGRRAECHLAISRDGGKTFTDRNMMDVLRTAGGDGEPALGGCNAPWVAIAGDNTMYFGGALFAGGARKAGRAGISVSTDGGVNWSPMVAGITIPRLAPGLKGLNGSMDPDDTPWDGANGIVDPVEGTFYSTAGAYITASDDRTRTFSTVYPAGGTATAAFGTVAAARIVTEFQNAQCPCLVFAASADKGKSFALSLVADAGQFNRQGTVRYPVAAANPAIAGSFALAVYAPDHLSVKVYFTSDYGKSWKVAQPRPIPPNISINNVNQAGIGYTSDGRILLTWRGFRNPGAFNTFLAMLDGDTFGPTIKISPELSIYPPLTYAGNYGNGNGGGDFTTWVTGNKTGAFVAFPYAPAGKVLDTYLARVPLTVLQ